MVFVILPSGNPCKLPTTEDSEDGKRFCFQCINGIVRVTGTSAIDIDLQGGNTKWNFNMESLLFLDFLILYFFGFCKPCVYVVQRNQLT